VSPKRILVCAPQVPFVHGGAELHVDHFIHALRNHGYETELISIPFQDYPHEAFIRNASLWRMLDVDADVVIATKFPSYYLNHPNKLVWLFHNYRGVYDLLGTPFSGYSRNRPDDLQLIEWTRQHDYEFLSEAKKIFTNSTNVQQRLKKYLNLESEALYAPPPLKDQLHCDAYDEFVLVAQRLDPFKRTELLIEAMALHHDNFKAVIAGSGPDQEKLRKLVKEKALEKRIEFVGKVSDEELLRYYARCRLVFFAPYDEDYGFTTLEAFQAKKPVLTATDSGGPLEFVEHQVTGWIASPDATGIAEGLHAIMTQPKLAQEMGERGFTRVNPITWEKVIAAFDDRFKALHL
jgi:glycosyltransferase involved in cell wall biosynthesis